LSVKSINKATPMLIIRLSKVGKKNKKMYRLTIAENTKNPYGDSLEILGSYNPHTKELQAKNDRILYWISKGAQPTTTVNNLLIEKKIIEGKKIKNISISKKRQEKITAKQEVSKPAPKAEEAPVVEETPTEETKA